MGENIGNSYISDKVLLFFSDKVLISYIYIKGLYNATAKKKSLINKWAQDLNRYYFKEKTYKWPTGA